MSDEPTDQDIRADLLDARLGLNGGTERSRHLLNSIRSIYSKGNSFIVLADTPDQLEDIFVILVDTDEILSFELSRGDLSGPPQNFHVQAVDDYRRAVGGGLAVRELDIALEINAG